MTIASRVFGRMMGLPKARTRVGVVRDLPVPTPDGAVLLADRWHPRGADASTAPIILVRTPYGRRGLSALLFHAIAERGYQVVVVSTRGTFGSAGDWYPFRNEKADGAAVLEWLPQQPWFVPNVATTGASYFGLTQWAVAEAAPQWLKAMTLGVTSSWFRDIIYPGEALALESMLAWIHAVEHQERGGLQLLRTQLASKRQVAAGSAAVPLGDADIAVVGHHVDFFQDWLAHEDRSDPWWAPIDFGAAVPTMPPTTMVAGWYDLFLPYQLDDFTKLRAAGRDARIVIGPWTHAHPKGLAALARETVEWADTHLRGVAASRPAGARVFVLGADEWRDLPTWPPVSTPTRLHLQAGRALSADAPAGSGPDRFRFDPADPTPSIGGASLARDAGPHDNRAREARHDVVVYTTEPLPQDVTVIGDITAELFVRSSLDHTDFFVRLCDVQPNGKSVNISDGIIRLPQAPAEQQPDGTSKVTIRMFPTAATFRRGHRIRLQVSSGAHPLYARNSGSGEPIAKATTLRVADQQIFHDPEHPSAVVLPVVG